MNDTNDIDDVAAGWVARGDRAGFDPLAQAELDAWLAADPRHRGAYVRAQAVFLHAERVRALGSGFGRSHAGRFRSGARHWWLAIAAAAALLAVALGLRPMLPGDESREFATGRGEVLRMALPDGSLLTLNSDSRLQLRYQEDERRLVLLQGEALVDVVRNPMRPFVVRTGKTDVVAVGTSFSVRKGHGEAFEVLVNEGVVDIRQPEPWQEPLRVRANFSVVSPNGSDVRIEPLEQEKVLRRLAWREGLLAFEGDTLADAALEFARYSDVHILIDDPAVANKRVVGVYSANDPEGFAKAVADSFGLRVEVVPQGVRLASAR